MVAVLTRLFTICALALLAFTGTVQALTVTRSDGGSTATVQGWIDHSHVATAPGSVELIMGAGNFDADSAALTDVSAFTDGKRMWLLTDACEAVHDCRQAVLHEAGHIFDGRVLTRGDRAAFGRIFREAWSRERFAEGYRLCAAYTRLFGRSGVLLHDYTAVYGYAPTASQHAAVCSLIRKAAAR